MAASSFLPPAQSFRPNVTAQTSFAPLSIAPPVNSYDRDATKPVGTPFSATPASANLSSAVIHNLPADTSEQSIRLMLVFSKDVVDVEILPPNQADDCGSRSALVKFKTPAGAQEAKNALDGKSVSPAAGELTVEILGSSPTMLGKRYPIDTSVSGGVPTPTSSVASSATSTRQTSRFNGTFPPMEKMAPSLNGVYNPDLTSPEIYQNIFSPQSPIGNHLTDRNRVSGKSLIIGNESADDDETGELLKDPVGFAENGLQRRQTAPQIPISRMANLNLNTTPMSGHAPIPHYGHPGMNTLSAVPNTMSPTAMGSGLSGPSLGYNQQQPYRAHNFPPANPADQNPPCNTLYVGNLPIDTSEEELKAMFSKQRGYKRLCFRTKQNGPMCFVEFEDVSFATKALNDLYGQPLHNSVKGGIRLSFSKNPLGVRSGQSSSQNGSSSMGGINGIPGSTGFTTAHGPPPGLSLPPGLGLNRVGLSGSPSMASGNSAYASPSFSTSTNNPWGPVYNTHSTMTNGSSNFPPHMMGR
ncbi:hypothetical protein OQA88_4717 [Cercophora sp. LCS_1]